MLLLELPLYLEDSHHVDSFIWSTPIVFVHV